MAMPKLDKLKFDTLASGHLSYWPASRIDMGTSTTHNMHICITKCQHKMAH